MEKPRGQQQQQPPTPSKPPIIINSSNIYSVRAMYLGSEPMGELLEGENGSDVIQVPLKRTILRTNGLGKEVELSVTHDSLQAAIAQSPRLLLKLPIELLAYCGALRQLPTDKIRSREFETLDKSPLVNTNNDEINPPLFVTIFRSLESENTLYCYSFVLRRDEEAMELVKVVMEIYYNLIRINEIDMGDGDVDPNANAIDDADAIDNDYDSGARKRDEEEKKFDANGSVAGDDGGGDGDDGGGGGSTTTTTNGNIDNTKSGQALNSNTVPYSKTSSNDYLNELLNLYKKTPANDVDTKKKDKSIVSANDILQKSLDPAEYRIVNGSGGEKSETNGGVGGDEDNLKEFNLLTKDGDGFENVPLNEDDDPIIIKRPNNEEIVYKQNVFIRWLQPPTPPPPAPIIIREVQEPVQEQLPPLVIYKQAPRPATPPPLIIRERPPSPLCTPTDPLIIERRVAVPERHRKIIIEHLPAPPPKPRDIILEKWLPRESLASQPRAVYVQKAAPATTTTTVSPSQLAAGTYHTRPVYEVIEHHHHHHQPRRDLYEILDSTCTAARLPAALAAKQYGSQMNSHHHHHCKATTSTNELCSATNMLQLRRSNSNELYHHTNPHHYHHLADQRASSANLQLAPAATAVNHHHHILHHSHHHSAIQSPSCLYSSPPSSAATSAAAAATTTTTTTHTVHHHHHLPPGIVATPSTTMQTTLPPPALIECSCSLVGKKGGQQVSGSSLSSSTVTPKIAGYRIIRQIIPGPNSKPADIERALAASAAANTQPPHIYSPPSYDTSLNLNLSSTTQAPPIYSTNLNMTPPSTVAAGAANNNIYCSSLHSASTTYCAYPRSLHPRPIILQQHQQSASIAAASTNPAVTTYSPHSNIYSPTVSHSQSSNPPTTTTSSGVVGGCSGSVSNTNSSSSSSSTTATSTTLGKTKMLAHGSVMHPLNGMMATTANAANCCYIANCCKKRGELYRSSSIDNF